MLSATFDQLRILRCHHPSGHPEITEFAPVAREVTIFLTSKTRTNAETASRTLLRHAMTIRYGRRACANVTFAVSGYGQPLIEHDGTRLPCTFSTAAAADQLIVAVTNFGRIGIDVETADRVALNATAQDRWLSVGERSALTTVIGDSVVDELSCHWVLKEAYGKARGVGLNYALADLTFQGCGGRVRASASKSPEAERVRPYAFALFRHRSLVVGLAHIPV
jgi:hypothetical protein